jgi:hypothetical protein
VPAIIAAEGDKASQAGTPLFQTLDTSHRLTVEAITRRDVLRVVKERCRAAG